MSLYRRKIQSQSNASTSSQHDNNNQMAAQPSVVTHTMIDLTEMSDNDVDSDIKHPSAANIAPQTQLLDKHYGANSNVEENATNQTPLEQTISNYTIESPPSSPKRTKSSRKKQARDDQRGGRQQQQQQQQPPPPPGAAALPVKKQGMVAPTPHGDNILASVFKAQHGATRLAELEHWLSRAKTFAWGGGGSTGLMHRDDYNGDNADNLFHSIMNIGDIDLSTPMAPPQQTPHVRPIDSDAMSSPLDTTAQQYPLHRNETELFTHFSSTSSVNGSDKQSNDDIDDRSTHSSTKQELLQSPDTAQRSVVKSSNERIKTEEYEVLGVKHETRIKSENPSNITAGVGSMGESTSSTSLLRPARPSTLEPDNEVLSPLKEEHMQQVLSPQRPLQPSHVSHPPTPALSTISASSMQSLSFSIASTFINQNIMSPSHTSNSKSVQHSPSSSSMSSYIFNILSYPLYFHRFFPYYEQLKFVYVMLKAIELRQHALLESPTGTGKSISLLVAVIGYLTKENYRRLSPLRLYDYSQYYKYKYMLYLLRLQLRDGTTLTSVSTEKKKADGSKKEKERERDGNGRRSGEYGYNDDHHGGVYETNIQRLSKPAKNHHELHNDLLQQLRLRLEQSFKDKSNNTPHPQNLFGMDDDNIFDSPHGEDVSPQSLRAAYNTGGIDDDDHITRENIMDTASYNPHHNRKRLARAKQGKTGRKSGTSITTKQTKHGKQQQKSSHDAIVEDPLAIYNPTNIKQVMNDLQQTIQSIPPVDLRITRVIITSRTHKQLSQLIDTLKTLPAPSFVHSSVLASRKHLCSHPMYRGRATGGGARGGSSGGNSDQVKVVTNGNDDTRITRNSTAHVFNVDELCQNCLSNPKSSLQCSAFQQTDPFVAKLVKKQKTRVTDATLKAQVMSTPLWGTQPTMIEIRDEGKDLSHIHGSSQSNEYNGHYNDNNILDDHEIDHPQHLQPHLLGNNATSCYDIEDLYTMATNAGACAYYASKNLALLSPLVFCPYIYLLNPYMARAGDLHNLVKDSVIVFDEAHNLDSTARDAMTFEINLLEILRAIDMMYFNASVGRFVSLHYTIAVVTHCLLACLGVWVKNQAIHQTMTNTGFSSSFHGGNDVPPLYHSGTSFVQILQSVGLRSDVLPIILELIPVMVALHTEQGESDDHSAAAQNKTAESMATTTTAIALPIDLHTTSTTANSGAHRTTNNMSTPQKIMKKQRRSNGITADKSSLRRQLDEDSDDGENGVNGVNNGNTVHHNTDTRDENNPLSALLPSYMQTASHHHSGHPSHPHRRSTPSRRSEHQPRYFISTTQYDDHGDDDDSAAFNIQRFKSIPLRMECDKHGRLLDGINLGQILFPDHFGNQMNVTGLHPSFQHNSSSTSSLEMSQNNISGGGGIYSRNNSNTSSRNVETPYDHNSSELRPLSQTNQQSNLDVARQSSSEPLVQQPKAKGSLYTRKPAPKPPVSSTEHQSSSPSSSTSLPATWSGNTTTATASVFNHFDVFSSFSIEFCPTTLSQTLNTAKMIKQLKSSSLPDIPPVDSVMMKSYMDTSQQIATGTGSEEIQTSSSSSSSLPSSSSSQLQSNGDNPVSSLPSGDGIDTPTTSNSVRRDAEPQNGMDTTDTNRDNGHDQPMHHPSSHDTLDTPTNTPLASEYQSFQKEADIPVYERMDPITLRSLTRFYRAITTLLQESWKLQDCLTPPPPHPQIPTATRKEDGCPTSFEVQMIENTSSDISNALTSREQSLDAVTGSASLHSQLQHSNGTSVSVSTTSVTPNILNNATLEAYWNDNAALFEDDDDDDESLFEQEPEASPATTHPSTTHTTLTPVNTPLHPPPAEPTSQLGEPVVQDKHFWMKLLPQYLEIYPVDHGDRSNIIDIPTLLRRSAEQLIHPNSDAAKAKQNKSKDNKGRKNGQQHQGHVHSTPGLHATRDGEIDPDSGYFSDSDDDDGHDSLDGMTNDDDDDHDNNDGDMKPSLTAAEIKALEQLLHRHSSGLPAYDQIYTPIFQNQTHYKLYINNDQPSTQSSSTSSSTASFSDVEYIIQSPWEYHHSRLTPLSQLHTIVKHSTLVFLCMSPSVAFNNLKHARSIVMASATLDLHDDGDLHGLADGKARVSGKKEDGVSQSHFNTTITAITTIENSTASLAISNADDAEDSIPSSHSQPSPNEYEIVQTYSSQYSDQLTSHASESTKDLSMTPGTPDTTTLMERIQSHDISPTLIYQYKHLQLRLAGQKLAIPHTLLHTGKGGLLWLHGLGLSNVHLFTGRHVVPPSNVNVHIISKLHYQERSIPITSSATTPSGGRGGATATTRFRARDVEGRALCVTPSRYSSRTMEHVISLEASNRRDKNIAAIGLAILDILRHGYHGGGSLVFFPSKDFLITSLQVWQYAMVDLLPDSLLHSHSAGCRTNRGGTSVATVANPSTGRAPARRSYGAQQQQHQHQNQDQSAEHLVTMTIWDAICCYCYPIAENDSDVALQSYYHKLCGDVNTNSLLSAYHHLSDVYKTKSSRKNRYQPYIASNIPGIYYVTSPQRRGTSNGRRSSTSSPLSTPKRRFNPDIIEHYPHQQVYSLAAAHTRDNLRDAMNMNMCDLEPGQDDNNNDHKGLDLDTTSSSMCSHQQCQEMYMMLLRSFGEFASSARNVDGQHEHGLQSDPSPRTTSSSSSNTLYHTPTTSILTILHKLQHICRSPSAYMSPSKLIKVSDRELESIQDTRGGRKGNKKKTIFPITSLPTDPIWDEYYMDFNIGRHLLCPHGCRVIQMDSPIIPWLESSHIETMTSTSTPETPPATPPSEFIASLDRVLHPEQADGKEDKSSRRRRRSGAMPGSAQTSSNRRKSSDWRSSTSGRQCGTGDGSSSTRRQSAGNYNGQGGYHTTQGYNNNNNNNNNYGNHGGFPALQYQQQQRSSPPMAHSLSILMQFHHHINILSEILVFYRILRSCPLIALTRDDLTTLYSTGYLTSCLQVFPLTTYIIQDTVIRTCIVGDNLHISHPPPVEPTTQQAIRYFIHAYLHICRQETFYSTTAQSSSIASTFTGRNHHGNGKARLSPFAAPRYSAKPALCLGVTRGKLSEGMNISDNDSRHVVMVGQPFMSLQSNIRELNQSFMKIFASPSSSPIPNWKTQRQDWKDWYTTETIRVIQQTCGRAIRHRFDFGSIYLLDRRYDPSVNTSSTTTRITIRDMPSWIRGSYENNHTYQSASISPQHSDLVAQTTHMESKPGCTSPNKQTTTTSGTPKEQIPIPTVLGPQQHSSFNSQADLPTRTTTQVTTSPPSTKPPSDVIPSVNHTSVQTPKRIQSIYMRKKDSSSAVMGAATLSSTTMAVKTSSGGIGITPTPVNTGTQSLSQSQYQKPTTIIDMPNPSPSSQPAAAPLPPPKPRDTSLTFAMDKSTQFHILQLFQRLAAVIRK